MTAGAALPIGQPQIELLGVTTTFGSGTVEQAYNQTRKQLIGLERPEIPLFQALAGAATA